MVRSAADYVTLIIRRPHAYQFLIERFADPSEEVSGSEAGLAIGPEALPIPGIYLLAADGTVLGKLGIQGPEDRDELLLLLRKHRSP